MELAAVREDVAVIDVLLHDIVHRPMDRRDLRDLLAKPREWDPAKEAGVAAETVTALDALLGVYETGCTADRDEVRGIFQEFRSFRSAAHLPREWDSLAEFRRRLVYVSAAGQGSDPRDELVVIWSLCNRARELGIDVEPVLREVADLSSDEDLGNFGSTRTRIMRGLEEHDLGRP